MFQSDFEQQHQLFFPYICIKRLRIIKRLRKVEAYRRRRETLFFLYDSPNEASELTRAQQNSRPQASKLTGMS